MPSIEFGPKGPQAARAVTAVPAAEHGAATATAAAQAAPGNDRAPAVADTRFAVVRSTAVDPGQPPIDADRVQEIRRAIEKGTYPIVPARVADAMIAAGLLLRSGK